MPTNDLYENKILLLYYKNLSYQLVFLFSNIHRDMQWNIRVNANIRIQTHLMELVNFSNPVEKYFHKPKIKSVWCKYNEVKIFKCKLKSKKIRRDVNIDIS